MFEFEIRKHHTKIKFSILINVIVIILIIRPNIYLFNMADSILKR